MLIKITTFDLETMQPLEENGEMHCNLMIPEKQEWLRKHLMWAAGNKHGVQILNNACSQEPADVELQEAYEEQQRAYHANRGTRYGERSDADRDRPVRKVQKVG